MAFNLDLSIVLFYFLDIVAFDLSSIAIALVDQSSDVLAWPGCMPLFPPQVAVEVLDDNDNTPDFGVTAVPEVNIPESSAVGVRLPDVFLATDEDDDSNAAIRYSITPEFFAVDENTGMSE